MTDDPGNPPPDTSLDRFGHGTQVAGVLGGATYGVAKNVTLVAVRLLDCTGLGTSIDLITAIDWVTQDHTALRPRGRQPEHHDPRSAGKLHRDRGRDLQLDLERGDVGPCRRQPLGRRRELFAGPDTGGDHRRRDVYVRWRLRFRAGFSNTGPEIDLYAPGVASPRRGSRAIAAAECSGTSMAAPQVAGVVARFLQLYWWAPPGHVNNRVVHRGRHGRARLGPGRLHAEPAVLFGLPGSVTSFVTVGGPHTSMSRHINVNPGHYKVRGRERQGEDILHVQQKQAFAAQDAGRAMAGASTPDAAAASTRAGGGPG